MRLKEVHASLEANRERERERERERKSLQAIEKRLDDQQGPPDDSLSASVSLFLSFSLSLSLSLSACGRGVLQDGGLRERARARCIRRERERERDFNRNDNAFSVLEKLMSQLTRALVYQVYQV